MKQVSLSAELSEESRRKWEEFCAALQNAGIAFPDDSELKAAFPRVFVFSDFVAKQCIRHPAIGFNLCFPESKKRQNFAVFSDSYGAEKW